MALPREPRQKMINIMYLVLTAILALNVSAEILNAFKVVDKSLMTSSTNINASNDVLYKSLKDKLTDPNTDKVLAKTWHDHAATAKKLSAEMDTYIEDLKKGLKNAAGLRMKEKDGKPFEDFKEDNLDASTRLFETEKKGEEFEKRLNDYKKALLDIDPAIRKEYANSLPISTEVPPSQEGGTRSFTTTYFHMTPTVAALTMLSKFQNNVKTAENQVVTFCHNKIGQVEVHMDQVGVLVGQNSNYLMPGDKLEVTAGVGAYSSSADPTIMINGAGVKVEKGQGKYEVVVNGAGERTIPIKVTFKNEQGQLVTVPSEVKYTIGVPGGAAVMLDKMNVFYIGVDNPVTIGSPTGWDKTNVGISGSGATISGTGSKRTVRVTTVGKSMINVTANGKTTPFEFRVKRIPDPVFKVGPGGTRMPTVTFKNQQFCRAELENFDFDIKYSIVSATVYFSGAGFPNVVQAQLSSNNLTALSQYMQRCQPGSAVTFDNVKITGPDGSRNIQGVGVILY